MEAKQKERKERFEVDETAFVFDFNETHLHPDIRHLSSRIFMTGWKIGMYGNERITILHKPSEKEKVVEFIKNYISKYPHKIIEIKTGQLVK